MDKTTGLRGRSVAVIMAAVWLACVAAAYPVRVVADESAAATQGGSLLITEVQAGSDLSASEEFIEIYNPGAGAVALDGWRIEVANAAAVSWDTPHRTIPLAGAIGAGEYLVAASGQYLETLRTASFSAGVAAAAGHVRLVQDIQLLDNNGVCAPAQAVIDELEWGVQSLDGRTPFALPQGEAAAAGSMQRKTAAQAMYVDTNTDTQDFALAAATPGAPSIPVPGATPAVRDSAVAGSNCTLPPAAPELPLPPKEPEVEPAPSPVPPDTLGLLAPQISELLPNPAAPLTDANDEFVELYNPNNTAFNLAGFSLHSGLNGTYSYTFPEGTVLPAAGFTSFLSKDTGLVLSNTTGKATLLDTAGTVVAESDVYDKALPGVSWIFAENTWRWTTVGTVGAPNVLAEPVAKTAASGPAAKPPKAVKAAAVKKPAAKTAAAAKAPKATLPEAAKTELATTKPAESSNPLHPGVLAAAAILAVLYGAYEYRHDVANKIREFRANRGFGRTPGRGA